MLNYPIESFDLQLTSYQLERYLYEFPEHSTVYAKATSMVDDEKRTFIQSRHLYKDGLEIIVEWFLLKDKFTMDSLTNIYAFLGYRQLGYIAPSHIEVSQLSYKHPIITKENKRIFEDVLANKNLKPLLSDKLYYNEEYVLVNPTKLTDDFFENLSVFINHSKKFRRYLEENGIS